MNCRRFYVEYSHVLFRDTADFAHASVTCVCLHVRASRIIQILALILALWSSDVRKYLTDSSTKAEAHRLGGALAADEVDLLVLQRRMSPVTGARLLGPSTPLHLLEHG